jgi:phytoene/squalene synthetase
VGRAYATIGCARSVLIDARRRRVRLPADKLAEAAVDLDKLFELRAQPALAACLRQMAEAASGDLNAARARAVPRNARPLTITGRLTSLHLERLRRAAYDPFDPAVIAAPPLDVWRLLWTALAGRF